MLEKKHGWTFTKNVLAFWVMKSVPSGKFAKIKKEKAQFMST